MLSDPSRLPIDYATLAETLDVLGYPARLELLDMLRFPQSVAEIRLTPTRQAAGENPERAISKQAVQSHLDKLVDAGLVRVEQAVGEGRVVNRYVVSAPQLYGVIEEMRSLCVRYAGRGSVGNLTGTLQPATAPIDPGGPRLTLVHGVYEGKPFPLTSETAREGRWTIGRQRDSTISLDYDPFVSAEHAEILLEGTKFVLHDLPRAKNGTFVNWRELPKGGKIALKGGDVIGVGRSFLVFAPE